jgi:hypothetical protein
MSSIRSRSMPTARAGPHHRPTEQVMDTNMGQRSPVSPDRGSHTTERDL